MSINIIAHGLALIWSAWHYHSILRFSYDQFGEDALALVS